GLRRPGDREHVWRHLVRLGCGCDRLDRPLAFCSARRRVRALRAGARPPATASALYEPVHGSAPDIAGQGKANPLAAILTIAMLLEHTAKRSDLAKAVDDAVEAVLDAGLRTSDPARPGEHPLGTAAMGDAVLKEVERRLG